ncbi:MAG TPA: DUF5615 family PIN-like protein [Gemmatimonadota bacterium]|nr:DUF5615 family PIN-like protein [Gemmatimonadota bacterium]
MKLLFDANISHRLADSLSDLYPGSVHVRLVGLQRATDREIWDYARTTASRSSRVRRGWACRPKAPSTQVDNGA